MIKFQGSLDAIQIYMSSYIIRLLLDCIICISHCDSDVSISKHIHIIFTITKSHDFTLPNVEML